MTKFEMTCVSEPNHQKFKFINKRNGQHFSVRAVRASEVYRILLVSILKSAKKHTS